MITNKKTFLILLLCSIFLRIYGQGYNQMCQKALLQNKAGKQYLVITDSTATYVTFLGQALSKGKSYKIISIKKVWGINKHTYGYIWVYNGKNQYVGRYVLGDALDLPVKLEDNRLLFSNKGKGCSKIINSKVNFYYGIPKRIQLPVCGGMGDIYEFSE